MNKLRATSLLVPTVLCMGFLFATPVRGQFHWPVGIAYATGIQDALDQTLDAYETDWEDEYGANLDIDRLEIPVGLVFNPYYEWDIGISAGLSLGPTMFVFGYVDVVNGSQYGVDDDTKFSFVVPVGVDVRYTLFRHGTVSPYVRIGLRYPIAGGDGIESSSPGPFGAVGVEFWRNKAVGLGVEIGYDASELEIESDNGLVQDDVTFTGFTVSLLAVF